MKMPRMSSDSQCCSCLVLRHVTTCEGVRCSRAFFGNGVCTHWLPHLEVAPEGQQPRRHLPLHVLTCDSSATDFSLHQLVCFSIKQLELIL